jgi:hypothetical protein
MLMGKLFSEVLGKPVRIDNPLLHKTKTEVISTLVAESLSDLIPKTTPAGWHDRPSTVAYVYPV